LQAKAPEVLISQLQRGLLCAQKLQAAAQKRCVRQLEAAVAAWEVHAGISAGTAARAGNGSTLSQALKALQVAKERAILRRVRCVVTTKSTRSTTTGTTMKPKPQIKRGMTNNPTITNKYRNHKEQRADIATSPSLISTSKHKTEH
jgi:hypothetical protein